MAGSEKCFICKENIEESSRNVSHLKIDKLLKQHSLSRKNYTRPDSIKAARKLNLTPRRHQNVTSTQLCDRLCLNLISKQIAYFVLNSLAKSLQKKKSKFQLKGEIIDAAEKRKDQEADEVKLRLGNVSDFVAADAIYHQDCFAKFFSHSALTGKRR
ncbi:hypothetical protein PR048_021534 [Dryococelus australis]|uniref:Uncharacterized protein n=1 Tax=Dryococelus australis TaxID=614101 RepID=A0ABQ9GYG2_9NEOP|nr:hypothetical protein PR048_021534 [Dryococelus australis]